MPLSIFADKQRKPEYKDVIEVLGGTAIFWDTIKNNISSQYPGSIEEWKYYSKSSGWTLLLKYKKRTILYLFPCDGYITVLFVFGERAVQKAYENDLPQYIIERIESAVPYMEGRSFQIDVKNESDIEHVKKLIDIKTEN